MRRLIIIVVGISILLVLLGYGIYSVLFTQEVQEEAPLVETPTTPPPPPKVTPIEEQGSRNIEVLSVEGKVERRLGASAWEPLKKGDRLEADETVQAHQDGRAVMDIENAARVELTPNSDFTVKEVSSRVSRVRINQGRLSAVVTGKEGNKLVVETEGSEATAVSEEGKFSVLADGKGQMVVATESGRVNLTAENETVVVKEGMQSVAHVDAPPTAPTVIPQSLFLKVGRPGKDVIRQKETTITGRTNPGAVVSINGIRMTVDKEGRFSGTVPLKEGKNQLTVSAEHVSGMEKERLIPAVMVDTRPPQVKSAVQWGEEDRPDTP